MRRHRFDPANRVAGGGAILWPDPIVAGSHEALASAVRRLWARAERVQIAVSKSGWLLAFADQGFCDPRTVSVVTTEPTPPERPVGWGWATVADPPVPEFLLFYTAGTAFPQSALILAGHAGPESWATFHQRPIVLHRLQERFDSLISGAEESLDPIDEAAAISVRRGRIKMAAASIREEARNPNRVARPATGTPAAAKQSHRGVELVSPGELYRRVLAAHFARPPHAEDESRPASAPALAAHQERAYERARDILDRYGGVIVADAVGLGKTYVGLRLIERVLERGDRAILIVPAALKRQWQSELAYLGARADSAPNQVDTGTDASEPGDNLELWTREERTGTIALLSVEVLGRRTFDPAPFRGAALVLVDEAHNFRNPATRRYRNLADLVRGSCVVLMTATPINNSILDLEHLIDLFAAPGAFRHLGVPDYHDAFRRAQTGCGHVRPIVSACVLRRTRRFLREHYGDVRVHDPGTGETRELRFPDRLPPVRVDYDLAGTYGELFGQLEKWMDDLHFPHLDPNADRAGEHPTSPSDLLKIILLKRLESSIEAFRATVTQQLSWCDAALRTLDAGRILTRPDYRAIFRGPPDDPGSQLAFVELMLPAPAEGARDRIREFSRLLKRDRALLGRMHSALAAIGPGSDQKLKKLCKLIDGPLAGRKALVFTEFRDTARYIYRQLGHRPYLAQIDSGQARLGQQQAVRREVIERFAPRSNGLPDPPERERVDLLIATDVLSEGLNLQDASVVISYDLPWNPVRLMQRIGRIDRLGAVPDCVELYHFVPADELERLLGLMERLQQKVSTITATLGFDQPVLAVPDGNMTRSTELIRGLARKSFDSVELELEGPLDPEERAYIDYVEALKDGTLPAAAKQRTPRGSRTPSATAMVDEMVDAAKAISYWCITLGNQRRGLWLIYDYATCRVSEDQSAALDAFERARYQSSASAPAGSLDSARRAFRRHVEETVARLQAAHIAGDPLRPSLPQCRIAAWLARNFEVSGYRLGPDDRAAIGHILDRLARRFTSAGERTLADLAGQLPEQLDPEFLKNLDRLLGTFQSESPGDIDVHEVGTLLLAPHR